MIAVVLAVLALVLAVQAVVLLMLRRASAANHAKCIAHVASYTGDQFAALVLEEAATAYESEQGLREQKRIVNTTWVLGGPTVPALFLTERAAKMRGERL